MPKIMHVVGARPNFMKVAPVMAAMDKRPGLFQQVLVHTGQHYDYVMSQVFFEELRMPEPDEYLNVGSGSHAQQTAHVMLAFEPVLLSQQPDWVIVVGDVNSSLACALVCSKAGIPVAHVEAGLRSGDRSMPEEINRLLTDQIADLLFTPSRDADAHLLREGCDPSKIHLVGNVMIDTLVSLLPQAQARPILADLGLQKGQYVLVTLHRPVNVDHPEVLREILAALDEISQDIPVIFPVHPRTRETLNQHGLASARIRFLQPQGYLDFLALTDAAGAVITDSGGIQEETTYLGVPCLTVRTTTERPVTVTLGTNRLVASERQAILDSFSGVSLGQRGGGKIPELWDGHAAERIVEVMAAQVI
ncbi:MAG: UDP-N-acetylglucosamine 2-epimerase (non-hydrolyzing) [Anaerolineales bacterium]|nr:UDP-N-acetylglucosamine 2-epimerase (non-hydrolyzing) [Anaerolineales bacterium]